MAGWKKRKLPAGGRAVSMAGWKKRKLPAGGRESCMRDVATKDMVVLEGHPREKTHGGSGRISVRFHREDYLLSCICWVAVWVGVTSRVK